MREVEKASPDRDTPSYDEACLAKYQEATGICLGDWNEKGVINTDIGIHRWTFMQFMDEQERKEYTGEMPQEFEVPKYFDLSKAEKYVISKEQLQLKQMQRAAEAAVAEESTRWKWKKEGWVGV